MGGLRLALFALSLILFRASGKTFIAAPFAFFGEMAWNDFLRIESWMLVYLVLAVASLFLAFNPAWLKRKTLLLLSAAGLIAALTHSMSVDCDGPIDRLTTFNFLGCVGGYSLSWLAVGASLLIVIVAFSGQRGP